MNGTISSPPLISVIIPTYHRNTVLVHCLEKLAPGIQTLEAVHYEVIVTDDGQITTAESLVKKRFGWVQWIAGPRRGPAANRNCGASHARGEWLAFTDDDCLPDLEWLAAYVEAIQIHSQHKVFEGRTYANRPQKTIAETAPINEHGRQLYSCNFAIARSLFASIGGFDERFPYASWEDLDLRLRLNNIGHVARLIPKASVCHPWRPAGGWAQFQKGNVSVLIYLALHPEESWHINPCFYLKESVVYFFKGALLGLLRLDFRGIPWFIMKVVSLLQLVFLLLRYPNGMHVYNRNPGTVLLPNKTIRL